MACFDFSSEAFYDNHTHRLFTDKPVVSVKDFTVNYYHGVRDAFDESGEECPSDTAFAHMHSQSVIQTLVHAFSQRFGCEASLEGLTAFRNDHAKTPEALKAYTEMLYKDANVCGTTLDCELPMGDALTQCFPCKVNRLFQYENVFTEQLKTAGSFKQLADNVLAEISTAASEGFAGLKGHIGEKYGGMEVRELDPAQAEKAFAAAQSGDKEAVNSVYHALFPQILTISAELNLPLNLHSGSTGFKKRTDFYKVDPILMAPFLKKHKFYKTKIVFLHESFPFTRNAAIMAYNFPNVYLDLSQTLPWQSLLFCRCLEDALSITPHDKIVLGTGQHWYAEMAWIASYIAKRSLERVMSTFVEDGLLSSAQAKHSARLVLSENGMKLYEK